MATTLDLITADEFAALPQTDRPRELVLGQVIDMNPPSPRHGKICLRLGALLANFIESHDLGHVMSNDSAVITRRNPDSVRGADVSYYSYARLPQGPVPDGYLPVAPDLVIEVLSSDDRWSDVSAKTAEYLSAGVSVVWVVDPRAESVYASFSNQPPRIFGKQDELSLPDLLGEFRVLVARIFE